MGNITNPVKPGVKTSSFAVTAGGTIGILALAGGIVNSAEQMEALTAFATVAITGLSAFISIAWVLVSYINKRGDINSLMIERGIIPDDVPAPIPTVEEAPAPVEGGE